MAPTRRRFLQMLGVAPALPLLSKLPLPPVVEEVLVPELLPLAETQITGWGFTGGAGSALVASGGFCTPMTPTYEFFQGAQPVEESLPVVVGSGGRGSVRYIQQG